MTRQLQLPLLALAALLAFAPLARADEPDDEAPASTEPLRLEDGDYFSQRFTELAKELSERIATPRAAAALYRLFQLCDRIDSLVPLAQTFARTADDGRALPEVRQLARWMLAQVDVSRARVPQGRAELARLGFVTDGWVVGGFDNEGGAGHATAYPPESLPVDLKQTYTGKEREVTWRRLPPAATDGLVPFGDVVRPRVNQTTYVVTTLESPAAQRATLGLGASGAVKLWVNGLLAVDDPDDHPARFDQRSVAVGLRKGSNVVLLKVSTLEETPGFYLRAWGAGGRQLVGTSFAAPDVDKALLPPPSAPGKADVATADRPAPVDDVTALLARLVEKSPNDGALREDYAAVLADRRPFDAKTQKHRREQERAATLLATDPRAWVRLSQWIPDDDNERRRALEKALDADPSFAPARTLLGLYYLDRGFARRAYDELVTAAKSPGYAPASGALADAEEALGFEGKAKKRQLDLAANHPTTPDVVLAAARIEKTLGRLRSASQRYQVALALRYDLDEARNELSAVLLDLGDVDGAAAALEKGLELHPTRVALGLRLASMLSTNDRPAQALAVYDRLALLAPDDEQVFEARGRHRLRTGDTDGAAGDIQQALALKPQNPQLRELLRAVRPQENYAAPYLRDALALAKAEAGRTPGADDDTIVLANVDVVRVYPNGLSSRYHQEVVRLVTDRGVDAERVQGVRYTPGEQEVKVEHARILKKDGSIVEAKSESDRQLTDAFAGMYFDHRQRVVSFPNLEPGDVLEWTYRLDDVSQKNMFADYFGDVEFLQGTELRRDVEYVLIAPAARVFTTNEPRLAHLEHSVAQSGADSKVWRWRARDVPKIDPEPKMPGWANVAAYLHVSTFKEWSDVARFWWGMVHDQLHVTPEVALAAEEAVKGVAATDVKGRVRAVYDYVVTKTRYVGLEFGIHGFKPYKVDRVLARRFGDCKDKASLMYAMLDHLGIKSKLVLLRMHHLGQLDPVPASLAVFNHAILYVPELDQYLDGTAEFSGSQEVPGSDQDAQALIVDPDPKATSRFVTTPVLKAEENLTATDATIQLAPDGSARLTGKSRVTGQGASSWRRHYESEADRRVRFEQGYAHSYPGAKAVSFEITDPRSIEKPVETTFVLDVPALGHHEDDALGFSPFGEPFRYVEGTAPLSRRSHPLDLGTPWRNEFTYAVALPSGMSLVEPPSTLEKTTAFGSYRYKTEKSAEGLKVTGFVAVTVDAVTPEKYAEFRAFLEDVDRTFSRRLRVVPSPGTRTPAATEASR